MSAETVEIVITPSVGQYAQLVRDLEALRKAGAESNTAAVLEALRREAAKIPFDEKAT